MGGTQSTETYNSQTSCNHSRSSGPDKSLQGGGGFEAPTPFIDPDPSDNSRPSEPGKGGDTTIAAFINSIEYHNVAVELLALGTGQSILAASGLTVDEFIELGGCHTDMNEFALHVLNE